MANKYFSQLTQLAAGSVASGDVIAIEDISAGETKYITSADYATYVSSTLAGASGGWDAVADTWAYLGTTTGKGTVTIPAGGTLLYGKGDKVKFTQGGTQLYFYVINASSGTTLVLTGGSDYVLGTATISGVYYSKTENPLNFPHWFSYVPTFGGNGSMSYTASASVAKFVICGRFVHVHIGATGTVGGTPNNTLTATLPVENANASSSITGSAVCKDGGNLLPAMMYSGAGTPDLVNVLKEDLSSWGAGSSREIYVSFSYPME